MTKFEKGINIKFDNPSSVLLVLFWYLILFNLTFIHMPCPLAFVNKSRHILESQKNFPTPSLVPLNFF